ncbi:hypothetical protein [Halomonas organivorans]|uniref:Uncharacterized protein n=1 Tax=Halomonas organivorans TaxID=257772 RepID=A0A7W5G485_9GAMM|nr:hypothetical protein [Halomonas organivorans]MBB3139879.1 hypothetical protein [Halomonas organivorans]
MHDARPHAIRDIAHRWFAFFEGETESIERHLDLFAPDVRLVHAGVHLLAEGQPAMARWLEQAPGDHDSHFIRDLSWQARSADSARMQMDIAYQVVQADGSLGGAMIHYETEVVFDANDEARFRFLQKTPLMPNPDRDFKDSFADNRLGAGLARLRFLSAQHSPERIETELLDAEAREAWRALRSTVSLEELADARLITQDDTALSLSLQLNSVAERRLALTFIERPGRYPSIRQIEWR